MQVACTRNYLHCAPSGNVLTALAHALQEHILSAERPGWPLQQLWPHRTGTKEAHGEDPKGEASGCCCWVVVAFATC